MRLLLVILFLCPLLASAQDIDTRRLSELVLEHVNELRKRKKRPLLKLDSTLDAPALDHARWMAENDKLTHTQKKKPKRSPQDRARFYECPHPSVAENVQYQPLSKAGDVEKLAQEIFTSWKKSRGHYLNMIAPDLTRVSHQFAVGNGKVYACQLFGTEPPEMPKDYHNAEVRNVKYKKPGSSCKHCQKVMNKTHWTFLRKHPPLGPGSLDVRQDSVFYSCTRRQYKQLLHGRASIGVDLMYHDQYPCGKTNRLHGSRYYDGYYIGHKTKPELKANYRQNGNKGIEVYMGQVPREGKYTPVLNFYRAKKPCVRVKMVDMPPLDILPPMVLPEPISSALPSTAQTLEHYDSITVELQYQRGSCSLGNEGKAKLLKALENAYKSGQVSQLMVEGVASLEGSREGNEKLFQCRVEDITAYVPDSLREKVRSAFFENEEGLRYMLQETGMQKESALPAEELRAWVNSRSSEAQVSRMLDQTRTSSLTVVTRQTEHIPDSLESSLAFLQQLVTEERYGLARTILASLADTLAQSTQMRDELKAIRISVDANSSELAWQRELILARADSNFSFEHLHAFLEIANARGSMSKYRIATEYAVHCELQAPGSLDTAFISKLERILKQERNKKRRESSLMTLLLIRSTRMPTRDEEFWIMFTKAAIRFDLPSHLRQISAMVLAWRGFDDASMAVMDSGVKKTKDPDYLFRYLLMRSVYDGTLQDDALKHAKKLSRMSPETFCKLELPEYMGTLMLAQDEWKELFCENCGKD